MEWKERKFALCIGNKDGEEYRKKRRDNGQKT